MEKNPGIDERFLIPGWPEVQVIGKNQGPSTHTRTHAHLVHPSIHSHTHLVHPSIHAPGGRLIARVCVYSLNLRLD